MTKVVNDIKHIFTAANELTGEDKRTTARRAMSKR